MLFSKVRENSRFDTRSSVLLYENKRDLKAAGMEKSGKTIGKWTKRKLMIFLIKIIRSHPYDDTRQ